MNIDGNFIVFSEDADLQTREWALTLKNAIYEKTGAQIKGVSSATEEQSKKGTVLFASCSRTPNTAVISP